jgi:hypothetical protein
VGPTPDPDDAPTLAATADPADRPKKISPAMIGGGNADAVSEVGTVFVLVVAALALVVATAVSPVEDDGCPA